MAKYKNLVIENVPYRSQSRWFILNEDGTRACYKRGAEIQPESTLKEAKLVVDNLLEKGLIK